MNNNLISQIVYRYVFNIIQLSVEPLSSECIHVCNSCNFVVNNVLEIIIIRFAILIIFAVNEKT